MFFLPEIQGRFAVGAITFVTPVRPACAVGSARLRNSSSTPAFCLQEVAFTAYYPAELTSKTARKGVDWLIRLVELFIISL
jgi:platelet-activating factor acetylhydrolase